MGEGGGVVLRAGPVTLSHEFQAEISIEVETGYEVGAIQYDQVDLRVLCGWSVHDGRATSSSGRNAGLRSQRRGLGGVEPDVWSLQAERLGQRPSGRGPRAGVHTPMTSQPDPLTAVQAAWQERQRTQAELRLADRALARAVLAAARADSAALLRLPPLVLGDRTVRGALDSTRLHPAPPHLHQGRQLADVLDLYVTGRLDRDSTVDILATWPYQAPDPTRDEAQPWGDSFASVEAAGDSGLLPRDLIADVRQRRFNALPWATRDGGG